MDRVRPEKGSPLNVDKSGWRQFFLPKPRMKHWTWKSYSLVSIGVLSFVDAMFIPLSRDVDPGRSGERMILLVLGLRAVYKNDPPISVLIAGAVLAALVAIVNHGVLMSSWISTSLMLVLLAYVVFWGIGKRAQS